MSADTANAPNSERELVFCHECHEEWYRDVHGIVCPNESCRSDFVEIIENNNDPRSDREGPPGLEPMDDFDFDEGEDEEHHPGAFGTRGTSPGGATFFRVDFTTRGGPGGPPPHMGHAHPPEDMIIDFFQIVRNIVGDHAMPPLRSEGQRGGNQSRSREGTPAGGVPGAGHGPHAHPLFFGGPGGFTFGASPGLSPRDAGSPQTGDPPAELPGYLAGLFGPPGGHGVGGDEEGHAMPGMNPRILLQLLGFVPPPGGGDYVYSQQELDRVISQLMEQHQGNAPPPASKEAIDSLPRIKVTEEMVNEGMDCAVCREDLVLEEEVTRLPCKHTYHLECVSTWLKEHDTCPICRHPVTPEDQRRQRQQPQQPGTGPGPSVMTWSFGNSPPGQSETHPHAPSYNSNVHPQESPGSHTRDEHTAGSGGTTSSNREAGESGENAGTRGGGPLNSFANLFRRATGGGGSSGSSGAGSNAP